MTGLNRLSLCLLAAVAFGCATPAVAAPASAAPIPVTGVVLDADGAPLAGAEARLQPFPDSYRKGRLRLDGRAWLRPAAEDTTGPDGRFRIPAPSTGPWMLVVRAPGRVTMQRPLWPLLEPIELVPVTLRPSTSLQVRVVDPSGSPVAGAVVAVRGWTAGRHGPPPPGFWVPVKLRTATTGTDGSVSVPCEPGERLRVEAVDGRRSGVASPDGPAGAGGASVVVPLEDGPVRTLRVVDAAGEPVPRAVVWGQGSVPIALTDGEGRAEVALLGGRPVPVQVDAPDGAGGDGVVLPPAKEDEPARWAEPVVVSVRPPEEILGRVVATDTGAPLAGAWVWPDGGSPDRAVETDGAGSFSLSWTRPPGEKGGPQLQGVAPGYLAGEVTVDPASRELPVLKLAPAAFVTGIVVDEADRPLPDVPVHLIPRWTFGAGGRSPHDMGPEGFARSGADGRFRIAPLSRDASYVAAASAPGRAPVEAPVPPAPEGSSRLADLRLVLGASAVARGRVVTPEGEPIPGARAVLVPRGEHGTTRQTSPVVRAVSDGDGVFTLTGLPSGEAALAVAATGRASVSRAPLEIPEGGGTAELDDVVLEPEARLEGRVVGPDGEGIANAGVGLFQQRSQLLPEEMQAVRELEEPVLTDADGAFSAPRLLADVPVHVLVSAEGYRQSQPVELVPPLDDPVTIRLDPATSAAGVVVDPAGRPVAGVRVEATTHSGQGTQTSSGPGTDEEGRFSIASILPGSVSFAASGRGYVTREPVIVEIAPGASPDSIRIEVVEGGRVVGRVVGPDGGPVEDAQVAVSWHDSSGFGMESNQLEVAADGSFDARGLPEQTVSLLAEAPGYVAARQDVGVVAGSVPSVELVLERGLEVSGQVVDASGRPLAAAQVTLTAAAFTTAPGARELWSTRPIDAQTDSDGRFRLSGAPPGEYQLMVRPPGSYQVVRQALSVADRSVSGVLVRIPGTGRISGRILGAEADEILRIEVTAFSEHGRVVGRVSPDGSYEIVELMPGRWRVVAQAGPGGARADGEVVIEAGDDEVRDLTFEEGLTVQGRVLIDGVPRVGLAVRVIGRGQQTSTQMGAQMVARLGHTGDGGRFEVSAVSPGPAAVLVLDEMGQVIAHRAIEVPVGGPVVLDLALHSVSGKLVTAGDAGGTGGIRVALVGAGEPGGPPVPMAYRFVPSRPDGSFTFDSVGDGRWRVWVRDQRFARVEVPVVVSGGDVELPAIPLTPARAPETGDDNAPEEGGPPPGRQN